jgi:hypothetical protein
MQDNNLCWPLIPNFNAIYWVVSEIGSSFYALYANKAQKKLVLISLPLSICLKCFTSEIASVSLVPLALRNIRTIGVGAMKQSHNRTELATCLNKE